LYCAGPPGLRPITSCGFFAPFSVVWFSESWLRNLQNSGTNYIIFGDESSFLGEEYMTVGGFAVSRNGVGKITKDLLAINEAKRARGEIKWHNTRRRGVEVRKAYIDYLMKQIVSSLLHLVKGAPPLGFWC
jgi:hypothetical protein